MIRSSTKRRFCLQHERYAFACWSAESFYRRKTYAVKIVEVRAITNAPLITRRLVRFVALGLSIWLSGVAAEAIQSVGLAWDPSPDSTVTGYFVRYGTESQMYSEVLDVGSATGATVDGLSDGQTYFFTVTAYNQQMIESESSGEIAYTAPAPDPGLLRIVQGTAPGSLPRLQCLVDPTYQYELQASEDLKSWQTIHSGVSLSTNWIEYVDTDAATLPKRFYRLALPDKPRVPGVLSILNGAADSSAARLRLSVQEGQHYEIQASQDLATWTTIHEETSISTEPMEFTDAQARLFPRRFYRLAFD